MTITERKSAFWHEWTPIEAAALCLKAALIEAGGTIIFSRDEIDIATGTIDIVELPNGDIKAQFLSPNEATAEAAIAEPIEDAIEIVEP